MQIKQTADQIESGNWSWSIWLEGSSADLGEIQKVVYRLHPTFANPVVERTNAANGFRLKASGWGTFTVQLEVHRKDGSVERLKHRLVFERETHQVFISHSSADREIVAEAVKTAADCGLEALSSSDIMPGEDWESEIARKLEESQLVLLVAGDSPSRYVMQEARTARDMGKPIVPFGNVDVIREFYRLGDEQIAANTSELRDALMNVTHRKS